jgi:hypothetical protein
MASWKDICLKKDNIITENNEHSKLGTIEKYHIPRDIVEFTNKKYVCIKHNISFENWFNFYEKELGYLYTTIRNYIVSRDYITTSLITENFMKFSKLIYFISSKKLF